MILLSRGRRDETRRSAVLNRGISGRSIGGPAKQAARGARGRENEPVDTHRFVFVTSCSASRLRRPIERLASASLRLRGFVAVESLKTASKVSLARLSNNLKTDIQPAWQPGARACGGGTECPAITHKGLRFPHIFHRGEQPFATIVTPSKYSSSVRMLLPPITEVGQ
jgi:hypothetical protein